MSDFDKTTDIFSRDTYHWKTDVEYGDHLTNYISYGKQYLKRECFKDLVDFINEPILAKVCALYGLRRTGKTVLLYQLMSILDPDTTAYIMLNPKNDILDLESDLMQLLRMGFKTVLVDEITYANDFASSSNLLADHYAMQGMKIVLSGTDSLGFKLASKRVLYDRIQLIRTTFISFKEYNRLLDKNLDAYISYGGTLLQEGSVPFSSIASSTDYMNSAIVENIQHSLGVLDNDPDFYTCLKRVYYDNQLTGLINRILDDIKHRFAERVLNKPFKSSNLGALTQRIRNLVRDNDSSAQALFNFISNNRGSILSKYASSLSIQEDYQVSAKVLAELQQYLIDLDVLSSYTVVDAEYEKDTQYIFTQPGMQYSQATVLVDICKALPDYKKLNSAEAKLVDNFLINNMQGHILEDIVINHTQKALRDCEVFQFNFDNGEFDMIILDHNKCTMNIYEIKHSSECVAAQAKHFCNTRILEQLEQHYYPIGNLSVLYMGEDCTKYVAIQDSTNECNFVSDPLVGVKIEYQNVNEFLCKL